MVIPTPQQLGLKRCFFFWLGVGGREGTCWEMFFFQLGIGKLLAKNCKLDKKTFLRWMMFVNVCRSFSFALIFVGSSGWIRPKICSPKTWRSMEDSLSKLWIIITRKPTCIRSAKNNVSAYVCVCITTNIIILSFLFWKGGVLNGTEPGNSEISGAFRLVEINRQPVGILVKPVSK